ncbi:MAG TPA: iron-sulfur cluster assembly scaffold protein [Blastocatellia bacterium]|nr:iron-sulfur cluster assembly scaffold protein [Blastocatellia bacterium]
MSKYYDQFLLEHYRHPRNYGTLPNPDIASEEVNPLCGDRIRIELALKDGVIEEARFCGNACVICIAAASILTELIIGAEIGEDEPVSAERLLASLHSEIRPGRINCALLPLETLRAGLSIYRQSQL